MSELGHAFGPMENEDNNAIPSNTERGPSVRVQAITL